MKLRGASAHRPAITLDSLPSWGWCAVWTAVWVMGGAGLAAPTHAATPVYGAVLEVAKTPPVGATDPLRAAADPLRAPEPIHLVAVMVEFAPDTNRFTTGDGTFRPGAIPYLESPGTNIDPLPHDRAYFQAHLDFTRHYFDAQSGGRLDLRPTVLPGTVRLPEPMAAYSPVGLDPGSEPLARLARDAWAAVAADPTLAEALAEAVAAAQAAGERVGFIVFHAGIGRDLELTGTVLDKTPQDIPSVYLDREALGRLLGDPAFDGFDLPGGIRVRNTMVVPRTQSRRGEDVTGQEFVLPLSVNGMLTAQVGSFLGLPDLFDTSTGQSGIGRFGLMDGAGIFAMNGLFPPGLSAWERIQLGLEEPVEIDPATLDPEATFELTLPAAHTGRDGSIIRIPVAQGEYYLLENRHRDPEGRGVDLTFRLADGSERTVGFDNLDEAFVSMGLGVDTLLPRGVLVAVSHHDFALPGGADTGGENRPAQAGDRQLNGGILIWHVDEGVIESALQDPSRGVNDDPEHRGVDLEEADGAQDIGYTTSLGFSSIDPTGSAFDFWWSGNDSRVQTQTSEITLYANRFDPGTTPAAQSNSGAPAWFRLFDFSDNLPEATVRLQALPDDTWPGATESDPTLTRLLRLPLPDQFGCRPGEAVRSGALIPSAESDAIPMRTLRTSDGRSLLLAAGRENLWSVDLADGTARVALDGAVGTLAILGEGAVAVVREAIAPGPSTVGGDDFSTSPLRELIVLDHEPATGAFTERWRHTVPMRQGRLRVREPGVLSADIERWRLDVATGTPLDPYVARELLTGDLDGVQAEWNNRRLLIKHRGVISQFSIDRMLGEEAEQSIGLLDDPEHGPRVVLRSGAEVLLTRPDYQFVIALPEPIGPFPAAFGDLDADGRTEILYVGADSLNLHAYTLGGAMVDAYPVPAPPGTRFSGGPRLVEFLKDAAGPTFSVNTSEVAPAFPELLVPVSRDGASRVVAFDASGRLLDAPRAAIGRDRVTPTADCAEPGVRMISDTLATLSPSGELTLYRLAGHTATVWGSGAGPTPEAGLLLTPGAATLPDPAYGLLHQAEVYNWPNPARDLTHIRFQTSEPASVRIQIISQDGRRLLDRRFDANGGAPEQFALDTSRWASGLYVVQVTASADGRTERKLFNMAVVH